MIGIDTNFLVKHLTKDDKIQTNIVIKVMDKYKNYPRSILINNIVLCEVVWVLKQGYSYSKKEIIKALRVILSTLEFAFEHHEILWFSLNEYEKCNADFPDILLSKINRLYGCEYTATFDTKAAASLKEFRHSNNIS